jgi:hypothetical protein
MGTSWAAVAWGREWVLTDQAPSSYLILGKMVDMKSVQIALLQDG